MSIFKHPLLERQIRGCQKKMARRTSMVCGCDRPTSFRWTPWVAAGTLLSWQNTGSNLLWFTLELMAQDEEAAPKGHLTPCAHTSYGVSTWCSWLRLLHGGLSQSAYSAFVTFCSVVGCFKGKPHWDMWFGPHKTRHKAVAIPSLSVGLWRPCYLGWIITASRLLSSWQGAGQGRT